MTDGATVQCRRCGFSNARGDQFCGSCGAFLEWQDPALDAAPGEGASTPGQPPPASGGQPPASGGPPPAPATPWPGLAGMQPTPIPSSDPGVPASSPATAPGPAAAPATPGAQAPGGGSLAAAAWPAAAATSPAEPDAEAGLLRCPACGIANPATRTFCQSCGTTLAAADRVAEPTRAVIEAAIVSPEAPTAPVAATGARPVGRDRPGGRGIPTWVFVVGLAGILVGVVGVLLGGLLAGPGPGSGATSAPSVASGGPSGVTGGSSPGATVGPATPAATAVKLTLTGATASSVVGDRAKFQPEMAIDGDLATSWQEGASDEKGQWIEVAFDPSRADTLVIRNGYQASTALYKGNLRLKDIDVSVDGGPPISFRLKDVTKAQRVDLGGVSGATTVRITIQSTYPSVKTAIAGTPFDDAAVSEISVLGIPGG